MVCCSMMLPLRVGTVARALVALLSPVRDPSPTVARATSTGTASDGCDIGLTPRLVSDARARS